MQLTAALSLATGVMIQIFKFGFSLVPAFLNCFVVMPSLLLSFDVLNTEGERISND